MVRLSWNAISPKRADGLPCFLCGKPELPHHICPAIWNTRSPTCRNGHDKQGKRTCPTCKADYDRRRRMTA